MKKELTRLIDECVFEGGVQSQYDDVQKYVAALLAAKDAEIERLTEVLAGKDRYNTRLCEEITLGAQRLREAQEAQAAEMAALRLDAERYRWLRHGDNDEKVLCNGPVAKDYWYLLRNEKLDAVIDAELEADSKAIAQAVRPS
ncbi:MAG: hypothetical protein JWR74_2007 [Polaromonas sp.]|nr:hypothetical protein [Polaromonas sp.]